MASNSLTREVGLKAGPILLEGLVKHYIDRLRNENREVQPGGTRLRQENVIYDEVFRIVKAFMETSTLHTVEELQSFSNTRTPSSPWTRVVRLLVPMSCCNDAVPYLIKAMGGTEVMKRVVGGVNWWQVRGLKGVDAQWITAKKDWREAKRRYKMQKKNKPSDYVPTDEQTDREREDSGVYDQTMDEMRCILYLHGGGYYFGSVDQERYCIERLARKISGRIFAINYRLAPQYPFPCAIHDALAAYLFLIRPPPDAAHRRIDPKHIVIAGDSAGGGLSLALLQVIRDSELPMPAGGLLISPWCDLTHSFPSIHTNTDTDIIAPSGLSFHKPSSLWPPPPQDISSRVYASLRQRVRHAFKMEKHDNFDPIATMLSEKQPSGMPVDVGETTNVPPITPRNKQTISLTLKSGEHLEIEHQIQLYAENSLLPHPLVSPVMSFLGGLPPLFFIAGDKEVLRDEIIYTAHKAANPTEYHIKDEARALYPALEGIEDRHGGLTSVHLQVYNDAPHILPVLFPFTEPSKFCYRAMATFTKFVTGINVSSPKSIIELSLTSSPVSEDTNLSSPSGADSESNRHGPGWSKRSKSFSPTSLPSRRMSIGQNLNAKMHRATSYISPRSRPIGDSQGGNNVSSETHSSSSLPGTPSPIVSPLPVAGTPEVYKDILDHTSWGCDMIRERVFTDGETRPLEPKHELDAFQVPPELIGKVSELAVRRYMKTRLLFDKKFSHTIKSVEKHRRRNLARAKEETLKHMNQLQNTLKEKEASSTDEFKTRLMSSPSWAWALDDDEHPPPSSLVSRRDTNEARRLAMISDQGILGDDQTISGNNLWSVVINFLTTSQRRHEHKKKEDFEEKKQPTLDTRLHKRLSSKLKLIGRTHSSTKNIVRNENNEDTVE